MTNTTEVIGNITSRFIDELNKVIAIKDAKIEQLEQALRQELQFHHKFSPPCFTTELELWK